ncbi:hypothetical protein FAUST_11105, partial [Fusarium austroamericanum]
MLPSADITNASAPAPNSIISFGNNNNLYGLPCVGLEGEGGRQEEEEEDEEETTPFLSDALYLKEPVRDKDLTAHQWDLSQPAAICRWKVKTASADTTISGSYRALELLQQRNALNYGSKRYSRPTKEDDSHHLDFRLDFVAGDKFWQHHQPAFHAYDFGANIQIDITDGVRNLTPETISQAGGNDLSVNSDANDEAAQQQLREESIMADSGSARRSLGIEADVESSQTGPSPTEYLNPNPDSLYSADLLHLREDLAAKYALNNIGHVSYALAVDLNCLDSDGYPRAMLADRNKVAAEYPCGSYNFYPLGLASKNATWPSILGEAIRHTREENVTAREWVDAIANQMAEAGIDWVPGSHCRRLTWRRVIQLNKIQHDKKPVAVLTGPPNSLKRAAHEAELRMTMGAAEGPATKRSKKRKIDVGCEIPFTKVPQMIREGFNKLEKNYSKTDPKAVGHVVRAYNCLINCLGDPLCDMMLLLALTFGACSVTPRIDEQGAEFQPAGKRKDPEMLAATMVIRMLWFLRIEDFPWDDAKGNVLSVRKMTQKIENRRFNNRGLLKLGWVEFISDSGTRRQTPRTTELKLKSVEELYYD